MILIININSVVFIFNNEFCFSSKLHSMVFGVQITSDALINSESLKFN